MNDRDIDGEVWAAADRVRDLAQRVTIDPGRQARLRMELLRRHSELVVEGGRWGTAWRSRRGRHLKRLGMAAPPAMLLAIAASVMLWILPAVSGHQTPQAAEASLITRALTRTAPTVTGWQWTLHEQRGESTRVVRLQSQLTGDQALYVHYGQAYLYSGGKWQIVSTGQPLTPRVADWQWGFTWLPSRLAKHDFTLLPDRVIDTRRVVGIQYTIAPSSAAQIVFTAWVDRSSGLVMRLTRVEVSRQRVVARDVADYRYVRNR